MKIRPACAADLPLLRAIYSDAVETAGPARYTEGQVRAWSAFAEEEAFIGFILDVHTYVAEVGTGILGFCGIAEDGHVASIYLRGDRIGQGIGAELLGGVLQRHPAPLSGRYHVEASAFSLPLFERFGFRLVGTEQIKRGGEVFDRFLMIKEA